jgi:hypothetical protein
LLLLVVAMAFSTATALAASLQHRSEAGVSTTAAPRAGEADEILLEVAYSWKVKGSRLSGTVTNGDRSDVQGTARVTRRSSGKTVTLATGGKLSVAAGHKQVLSLSLTKAGKGFFRRHARATAQLVLKETAGTRSGEETDDIKIHRTG